MSVLQLKAKQIHYRVAKISDSWRLPGCARGEKAERLDGWFHQLVMEDVPLSVLGDLTVCYKQGKYICLGI